MVLVGLYVCVCCKRDGGGPLSDLRRWGPYTVCTGWCLMPHTVGPSWRAAVRLGLLGGAGAPSQLSCFHHGDSVQVNFLQPDLISKWWKEREWHLLPSYRLDLESIMADLIPNYLDNWLENISFNI